MEKFVIRKIRSRDHSAVYSIMKSLDKWFDETALKNIYTDLKFHKGYAAWIKKEIIGFITYFVYEGTGHIGWLGVKQEHQNKKAGKRLLQTIENDFIKNNINTVQVFTLSDSVDYAPYEATRIFYYNNGFKEYRRIKTDNPSCPEELYLRKTL